jgi:hypothetical protein
MVRRNAIFDARNYPAERDWRSSDDFASLLAFAVFRRNLYDPDRLPRVPHVFEFPTDAKVGPLGRSLDCRFR